MENKFKLTNLLLILIIFLLNSCASMEFSNKYTPYPELPKYNNIKIAYVLSGGGARGLAHIGVIEELEKNNIYPDLIIGCSAGSIVGAMYAENKNINYVKKHILHASTSDILDFSLTNLPISITNTNSLQTFLENHLRARKFEQLKIPFIANATNLQFGTFTPMGSGNLINAVAASASFPGMFSPIKIGTQYYIDCGVINNIPVEIAKKYNPNIIIAVDISEGLPEQAPSNIADIFERSLLIAEINKRNTHIKDATVVIKPEITDVGIFSDKHNVEVYNAGKIAAREKISIIKKHISKV